MEKIIRILDNKDPLVRRKAIKELSEFHNPHTIEILLRSVDDDDSEVKMLVIESLGEINDSRAVSKLIDIIVNVSNFDSRYRQAARTSLVKIGELAVEHLISLLEDRNETETVRIRVASTLGSFIDPRVISSLINILNDGSESVTVRRYASHALGHIGNQCAVEPLTRILLDNRGRQDNTILRISAAAALGKIGGEFAVTALINALGDDNVGVQEQVIHSLQWLDIDPLEPLVNSLLRGETETGDRGHLLNALKVLNAITSQFLDQEAREKLKLLEPLFISLILEPGSSNKAKECVKALLSRVIDE